MEKTMITIKSTSKRGKAFINSYNGHNLYYDIFDAYDRPSCEKVHAWNECQNKYKEEGGRGIVIIGRNAFTFTVAWQTKEGLRVETAQNTYLIK